MGAPSPGQLAAGHISEPLRLCACLVDLTRSISHGELLDVQGQCLQLTTPLRDFGNHVYALPFEKARIDQHELFTEGGEILEVHLESTTYLLSGWIAARPLGTSTYLWFPLELCRINDV